MLKRSSRRYADNEEFHGFFWGLYKRNEFLLIISAAVFFGSLFIGYFLAGFLTRYWQAPSDHLKIALARVRLNSLPSQYLLTT